MLMSKYTTTAAYSIFVSVMLYQSVAKELLPDGVSDGLKRYVRRCFCYLSSLVTTTKLTMIIPETDGLVKNEIYEAADIYLGGKINPTTRRLRLSKPKTEKNCKIFMENNEEVPYIQEKAKSILDARKTVKLFTVNDDGLYDSYSNVWTSVKFDHPSTFNTLALHPELKKVIMNDLDGFINRKNFYKETGRAWKHGYLLYGPPGTGKSSLIAAMANYLNFDIYDLDLTQLTRNPELRTIMMSMADNSILVVEDIDCSIDLADRTPSAYKKHQVTLSAMLNFIDGIWSTCGGGRIIIFTTNHKHKIDPALLRPGRMDMHLNLSYCTPSGFKILASNYLKVEHHPLFDSIENLISNVEVTPAEVAEKLTKNDTTDVVVEELLDFLEKKKIQRDEAKAVKKNEGNETKDDKEKEEKSNKEDSNNKDDE
ncbi:hypothetical protein AQUCO_00700453v1 [Aquilegia coerulea]|uniref:AAA+ ATPase domain-containing protein n=1 Tax=Aquilegia coerulea TaxID=218851 RepID=A0A2G5EK28_AQUCA|nr:hypothetical protein AQUCO_00700453v1 [Aquilegia coerulea]